MFKKITLSFVLFFCVTSVAYALPAVIAHRGGGQNYPENTLLSFSKSLEMGCDALELDVQVTKDGVVIVYHPNDLKQWTNGSGAISEHDWAEIANLNAGYHFKSEENYPFRHFNLTVPTLVEVLANFPKTLIIIDMKSLPADTLVDALIRTISDEESSRLIFYSTNTEHLELLANKKPNWKMFEKRDMTRQRLLELNLTGKSELPLKSYWLGFELKRKMAVVENFALGTGTSSIDFHLWSQEIVSHLRELNSSASLILFGINKWDEWNEAVNLDVDGVYTDNPEEVLKYKKSFLLNTETQFTIENPKFYN